MTPVGARSRAPTGVVFSPKQVSKGLSPFGRRHSSSLLLNVYATVACRRRLQKAPRRIHERLEPIRDRRKARPPPRHSSSCSSQQGRFPREGQLSLLAADDIQRGSSLKPVACRRRLQKAPRRIRNPFATGARPWTKTPSSSGTCSKPATPKPAPGPRGIWMRSRKS